MSVIFFLIPLSILFAVAFLFAFIWSVRSGQYEDTTTPSMRVLTDESTASSALPRSSPNLSKPVPFLDKAGVASKRSFTTKLDL